MAGKNDSIEKSGVGEEVVVDNRPEIVDDSAVPPSLPRCRSDGPRMTQQQNGKRLWDHIDQELIVWVWHGVIFCYVVLFNYIRELKKRLRIFNFFSLNFIGHICLGTLNGKKFYCINWKNQFA